MGIKAKDITTALDAARRPVKAGLRWQEAKDDNDAFNCSFFRIVHRTYIHCCRNDESKRQDGHQYIKCELPEVRESHAGNPSPKESKTVSLGWRHMLSLWL